MQVRRGQLHSGNIRDLLQRAYIAQPELQTVDGQQLCRHPAGRLLQLHLGSRHAAGKLDQRSGGLLESDLHIGVEQRALQAKRQPGRQVAQVRLEIKVAEADACVGLARVGKRRGFCGGVETAAIEFERQARRGLDLAFGLQVA